MEKGVFVKEIKEGAAVRGVFAVAAANSGKTQKGDPYWTLTLQDRTGSIEGKIWAPESRQFASIATGVLADVIGAASAFRDRLQISVREFSPFSENETAAADLSDFVPASPVSADKMLASLRALCEQEFVHAPWRDFVFSVLDNEAIQARLKIAPAAVRVHQAYAGGLLEHTLNVARICRSFADLYPDLDRQTLIAGAILHDIGKIREYKSGLVIDSTDEGSLFGHIFLGLELLSPFFSASGLELPLREHLKHLIISHHGELEYGSPRLPQTAEAFALHYADNLDAKLALCKAQFENGAVGPLWSGKANILQRRVFLPQRTPENDARKIAANAPAEENPPDYGEIPPPDDDWFIGAVDPEMDAPNAVATEKSGKQAQCSLL